MTYTYEVNKVKVTLIDNETQQAHLVDEAAAYVEEAFKVRPDYQKRTTDLIFTLGEKEVAVEYVLEEPKFQRIRRITGYLVGDLSRFNNAKRAEEHDRIPHGYTPKPSSGLIEEE